MMEHMEKGHAHAVCEDDSMHKSSASASHSEHFVLTVRSHSGLSGDMLLTGFALLAMDQAGLQPESEQAGLWLDQHLQKISPRLSGCVKIGQRKAQGIAGWHAFVDLPEESQARGLQEILKIIEDSGMSDAARGNARACFELLGQCEAAAHGMSLDHVHFHEVGALDSILDICGICSFYDLLAAPEIVCSPLPLADGCVHCNHGVLPAPAPAVLQLLKGVTVRGLDVAGEVVTPTAIAVLRTLKADFGLWPKMRILDARLVYGDKTFQGIANGATFALGVRIDA